MKESGINSEKACAKINNYTFSDEEIEEINIEIEKLVKQKVIIKSFHEKNEIISNIFHRRKKDGSLRIILNIKKLNAQLKTEKFKMHSVNSAISLISKGCFMASIDLSNAYFSVNIHRDHQKFLNFFWNNVLYKFLVLPNGLCQAPFIFTKLTKPIYAYLHEKDHLITGYLDDSLLIGTSREECVKNITDTAKIFIDLGFTVHKNKSVLSPTNEIEYLGHVLNSLSMTIRLTENRLSKLRSTCHECLQAECITIRFLAKLIGLMVAAFLAIPYGRLYYRALDNLKTKSLKKHNFNWEKNIVLDSESRKDITWWIQNMDCVTPMKRGSPQLIITSDASLIGFGAVCKGETAKGLWSVSEKEQHINYLELLAAFNALKMFAKNVHDKHILLRLDNSTAVCLINKMGTCKSKTLMSLCINLFEWCRSRNLWISATYIPSKQNEADEASRAGLTTKMESEWQLNPMIFKESCKELNFFPVIDLFATKHNTQLDRFVSFKPDPEALFINSFSLNWGQMAFYAFPPFNLILRTLDKIKEDQGTGILVIPEWKSQPFYSLAMKMKSKCITLFPRKDLLIYPGLPQLRHTMKLKLLFL